MAKAIRLRVNVGASFPTQVVGANGVGVAKANGIYTIGNSYPSLAPLGSIPVPANKQVVVYDTTTGQYNTVPTSALPGASAGGGTVIGPSSSIDGDVALFSGTSGTIIRDSGTKIRTLLAAATTFYVNPTGSDSNSGLTTGSPFATIQGAYNAICGKYDTGGQTVTIQCANATYTAGLVASAPWEGGGALVLDLGGGTINSAGGHAIYIGCSIPSSLSVQNGTLVSGGGSCINHSGTGLVYVRSGVTFGSAVSGHMWAASAGSSIFIFGNYSITGGASFHTIAEVTGSYIRTFGNIAVTISGTPNINTFAQTLNCGALNLTAMTFSGSTTGMRYSAVSNGVISTGGGGANYFPGSIAGAVSSGGIYS